MRSLLTLVAVCSLGGCSTENRHLTEVWNTSNSRVEVRYSDAKQHVLHLASIDPGKKIFLAPNRRFADLERLEFFQGSRRITVPGWKHYHSKLGCADECKIKFTPDGRVGLLINPKDRV